MTETFTREQVATASRLLAFGLQAKQTPIGNKEYGEVVQSWLRDTGVQAALEAITEGLSMAVVDVDGSEGLVLSTSRFSSFAYNLTDIRRNFSDRTAAMIGLAYAAVAAAFYPTAQSIDSSDGTRQGVTIRDIRRIFMGAIADISARAERGEIEPVAEQIWQELNRLPEFQKERENIERQRYNLSSVDGLIRVVLSRLSEEGLVSGDMKNDDTLLMAKDRFRKQLRGRGGANLHGHGALALLELAQKAAKANPNLVLSENSDPN